MLRQRTIVAIILVPVVVGLVRVGGLLYAGVILAVLALGALEFTRMVQAAGADVSPVAAVGGTVAVAIGAAHPEQQWLEPILATFLIGTTALYAARYERGAEAPLLGWAATLAAGCYLGYLGGSLIALRELSQGFWWTMTVLPGVWLADTGAYTIGSIMGKHKLVPRLSPKKSWEGLLAGIVIGTVGAALLAAAWRTAAGPGSGLIWQHGAAIGFLVAVLGPVGDLGISMFKRQVRFKNTGNLLAGHGGVLDRIDSWLVAAATGFFYIQWFVLNS
ncbi:MAG: phosphatidate cytidylyltransferase [Anaerolineales bacterium]